MNQKKAALYAAFFVTISKIYHLPDHQKNIVSEYSKWFNSQYFRLHLQVQQIMLRSQFNNMKKIILSCTLLLTAATLTFTSCRKGEEDPAISFRSRDARITETWKLTGQESTTIYDTVTTDKINGTIHGRTEIKSSLSGSTFTTTTTSERTVAGKTVTNTYTSSGNGNTILTIEKNGKFTWESASGSDGNQTVSETGGAWYWVSDTRSKSQISMYGQIFDVVGLSGKELILRQSENNESGYTNAADNSSYKRQFSKEITYTFEKQ
jgi:hypothetical protein